MVARISLLASGVYTIALTYFSLIHLGKISVGSFNPTDKMLHATAYFLLVSMWKLYFIISSRDRVNYKANLFWISGLSILFGMLIEVLQGTLTSYRDPDWFDILANSTGVLLAVLIFFLLQGPLQRLRRKID
ncbi:VanZ family protein [Zunongwangia sp. F363]|uniref:VanZ family protein n=1 Tax=Autumnicola tepida TaxID=3075595 RepID=A0ABU3CAJ7_9FLAO|nr:VanZ family protein [Zunongwangia sp. F363]MDT0643364.1 VanZ family protein [Zunongwangia sp. F363]